MGATRAEDGRRWRRAVVRVASGVALAGCCAVAAAAVLLPPPARADARRPAERGPDATSTASARDGPLWPAGLFPPAGVPRPAPVAPPVPCEGGALSGTLNLNTATQEELERLPGIGPSKAQRILAWRQRHARFRHVRDLRRVKGFGRKTVLRLAPYLVVEGATTLRGGSR